jgi:hypothetical protein
MCTQSGSPVLREPVCRRGYVPHIPNIPKHEALWWISWKNITMEVAAHCNNYVKIFNIL